MIIFLPNFLDRGETTTSGTWRIDGVPKGVPERAGAGTMTPNRRKEPQRKGQEGMSDY
jgi:hypothetical protein